MRRLGFSISLTADGMYADPAGGLDVFVPSEEEHRFANQLIRDAGDVVVGRRMYEVMTYWDEVDLDDPATSKVEAEFARFWRDTPKHVVSRGQPRLGPKATLLSGEVIEARGPSGHSRWSRTDRRLQVPARADRAWSRQGDVRIVDAAASPASCRQSAFRFG